MSSIVISGGHTSSGVTFTSGQVVHVLSGGAIISTTMVPGSLAYVSSGGTVSALTLSATIYVAGRAVGVTAGAQGDIFEGVGGTASGTTLNSGSYDYVSGGTTSETTLNNGSQQIIEFGGVAVSATLNSGGRQSVDSGSTASATTINSGGTEYVYSGGQTVGGTVLAGGFLLVSSGGSAIDTTLDHGATEYLYSGTDSSGTIQSGAVLLVESGGIAAGTAVNSGGTLVVYSGGTASGVTLNSGGLLDLSSLVYSAGGSATFNSTTHMLTVTEGAISATVSLAGPYAGDYFHLTSGATPYGGTLITMNTTPCYAAGTRIATPDGARPIEALRAGDLVLNAEGEALAIKWLGHRQVNCAAHPSPEDVWPVRIRADAFAAGQPSRDLLVSPEHALFVDGFLMPARALLNGATIAQERVAQISYWHLELASHDVILAEGLPAESYLDTGNRGAFANAGPSLQLHPRFGRNVHTALACAPFADAGPHVARARAALLDRAHLLGFAAEAGAWWVEADGVALAPEPDGAWIVPVGAQGVWLRAPGWRPMDIETGNADTRCLGVCLAAITIDGTNIALDDPRLAEGFHAVETAGAGMWRWTEGDAVLPAALFPAGLECRLELAVARAPMVWRVAA